jgi:hypothetical protein
MLTTNGNFIFLLSLSAILNTLEGEMFVGMKNCPWCFLIHFQIFVYILLPGQLGGIY